MNKRIMLTAARTTEIVEEPIPEPPAGGMIVKVSQSVSQSVSQQSVSQSVSQSVIRLLVKSQEQSETRLRVLCNFILTMAVELLRFSYRCRTNVYER